MMASFLNEMKTVRLRKVQGSSANVRPQDTSCQSLFTQPFSQFFDSPWDNDLPDSDLTCSGLPDSHSWRERENGKIGEENNEGNQIDLHTQLMERELLPETNVSSTGTILRRRSSPAETTFKNASSQKVELSSLNRGALNLRGPVNQSTSKQVSIFLLEGATPSLCSDNSGDREEDSHLDDVLNTPLLGPLCPAEAPNFILDLDGASGSPHVPRAVSVEVIDVDALPDEEPVTNVKAICCTRQAKHEHERHEIVSSAFHRSHEDLFSKRPPSSPLPQSSPRKPMPPRIVQPAHFFKGTRLSLEGSTEQSTLLSKGRHRDDAPEDDPLHATPGRVPNVDGKTHSHQLSPSPSLVPLPPCCELPLLDIRSLSRDVSCNSSFNSSFSLMLEPSKSSSTKQKPSRIPKLKPLAAPIIGHDESRGRSGTNSSSPKSTRSTVVAPNNVPILVEPVLAGPLKTIGSTQLSQIIKKHKLTLDEELRSSLLTQSTKFEEQLAQHSDDLESGIFAASGTQAKDLGSYSR